MSIDRTPLDHPAISEALASIPGWSRSDDHIRRTWQFEGFDAAMEFINAVADVARELDHHPELTNVYDRVTLAVTTHDAGGLTAMDLEFARRVNALQA